MKGGYVLFNGKFHRENEPIFSGIDLYRLNAGIRESFRTENNLILFSEDNYNFLINTLLSLKLPVPGDWDLARFRKDVSRLLNKNHFFLAARVVIQFFPGSNGTDYLLTAEEIQRGFYPINETGLLIDFFEEGRKTQTVQAAFEPASRFLWAAATRAALSLTQSNMIIMNSSGSACETIGGSFGYIMGETVSFPSPILHGYAPPVLGVVMECAEKCGYQVVEKDEISREELLKADELFLIDNCLGVQIVMGLGSRRYYTSGSITIAQKLSEVAKIETSYSQFQ